MTTVGTSSARNYAESLFSVTEAEGTTEEVDRALTAIVERIASEPRLRAFLESPALSKFQRREVVEAVFSPDKGVPLHLFNFLRVLADGGRLGLLRLIKPAWRARLDERDGIVRFEVHTAREIEEAQIDSIAAAISATTGLKAKPESRIDAALLGGIVVQLGDKRIDGSVRTRLRRLRAQLSENPVS
jgi:F-type H+-transporting ATPase subunit delta